MSKLSTRAVAEIGATLAVVIGIGIGAAMSGDETAEIVSGEVIKREEKPAPRGGDIKPDGTIVDAGVPDATVDPFKVDTAKYHDTIVEAIRDAGLDRAHAIDILTEPVQPDAEVETFVEVPLGSRPDDFDLIGDAVGKFEIIDVAFADRAAAEMKGATMPGATVLRVKAKNTSKDAARLTGLVHIVEAP